jgi:hypothetical protein
MVELRRLFKAAPILLALAALLTTAGLVGCGDSDDVSFDESCSRCVNGDPVGPSASQEACQVWGDAYDCESAVLSNEGVCSEDLESNASCAVSNCERDPSPGCTS